MSDPDSLEYRVFKRNFDKLRQRISKSQLRGLVSALWSHSVICDETKDSAESETYPNSLDVVLNTLRDQIKLTPSIFHTFITVLEEKQLTDLARLLQSEYDKPKAESEGACQVEDLDPQTRKHETRRFPESQCHTLPEQVFSQDQSEAKVFAGASSVGSQPSMMTTEGGSRTMLKSTGDRASEKLVAGVSLGLKIRDEEIEDDSDDPPDDAVYRTTKSEYSLQLRNVVLQKELGQERITSNHLREQNSHLEQCYVELVERNKMMIENIAQLVSDKEALEKQLHDEKQKTSAESADQCHTTESKRDADIDRLTAEIAEKDGEINSLKIELNLCRVFIVMLVVIVLCYGDMVIPFLFLP